MPYRIDISDAPRDAVDVLVDLGALDVEAAGEGLAAILPDGVRPERVARVLGGLKVAVSDAVARDNGSVWLLSPRAVRMGSVSVAPAEAAAAPGVLRMRDAGAFGTGHHPTTALCVEAIEEILRFESPTSVLDVGTGSGILALTALMLGVPRAVGLDIDSEALQVAAENARLNQLANRLELVRGGPEAVDGGWPLVVANVLAAPLLDMAPILVRRVGPRARLILSGIPWSMEAEVRRAYQHWGMQHVRSDVRGGWAMLLVRATW